MNRLSIPLLAVSLLAGAAFAQHGGHGAHGTHGAPGAAATPYAGMQAREIKALSPQDARSLLEGQGMQLALAAELNGYPGPSHVLEHADALRLTREQRDATQALMQAHKAEARALGEQLVQAERDLDEAFRSRALTEAAIDRHTAAIAQLQGQLRAAHLRTHLRQTALLTPQQVAHYQQLRGYATAARHGAHHR